MTEQKRLFIISHSHWDREWYRTVHGYRFLLMDVLDELFHTLSQDTQFGSFLLDGQTVLLEDYLTLFPHRAREARELISAGRLELGPWYVQPDEFLVSGEALIRNLIRGGMAGRSLGGTSRLGWLPDTFGHIAQLPQILRNFDIDNFIFSRGLGDHPVPAPGYFWWDAPNGDRVLGLHQVGGYWNAGNLGFRSFWGKEDRSQLDLSLAEKQVRDLLARLDPHQEQTILALWNGADHTSVQTSLTEVIHHLKHALPGLEIRHGSVTSLVRDLWAHSNDAWPVITGEIRQSRFHPVLTGTFSSRMLLKQTNAVAQRGLERYAEPLASMAWLLGDAYPDAHLWDAWSTLIQNHCHDSICGCHIDAVTDQIQMRFSQVKEMASVISQRALTRLVKEIGVPDYVSATGYPLLVFNPLGEKHQEVVTATLRLASFEPPYRVRGPDGEISSAQLLGHKSITYEWLTQEISVGGFLQQIHMWRAYLQQMEGLDIISYQTKTGERSIELFFWLGDCLDCNAVTLQRLLDETAGWPVETNLKIHASYDELKLAFLAEVPACGYSVYSIESGADAGPLAQSQGAQARGRFLWNDRLEVEVRPDGRLTVGHRASGRVFDGLHVFENAADAGDTYDFSPLSTNPNGVRLSVPVQVEVLDNGPLRARVRLHSIYSIPASLSEDRKSRSGDSTLLPVITDLTLNQGSPYLEITSAVVNQARDHRLRVLFPCTIQTDEVHAGGHFCTLSRSLNLPGAVDWAQPPSTLQHHDGWFAILGSTAALAILTEGLPEHQAWPENGGTTLALTLMRCVGWLSRGDLVTRRGHAGPAVATPEAQLLGSHEFRYGILPLSSTDAASVARIAETFNTPLLLAPIPRRSQRLPSRWSFITLGPEELAISAVKRSEDGKRLVVRFFNRNTAPVTGHLRFSLPMKAGWVAKANEQPIMPLLLHSDGHACDVQVGPAQIVTLLLEPHSGLKELVVPRP